MLSLLIFVNTLNTAGILPIIFKILEKLRQRNKNCTGDENQQTKVKRSSASSVIYNTLREALQ